MKFIISGASGVLGFALIKKILEAGNNVSLLARSEKSLIHVFEEFGRDSFDSLHFIDLSDYSLNAFDLSGDVFIHLAWAGVEKDSRNNIDIQMKNVQYTLDAIRMARLAGCKTFVGAGSQAEFANSNTPMGNNTPTIPNTSYGAAKLAAGQMGRILSESLGIKFYWFRIFSLYGPYDRSYSFISIMLKKFLSNELLQMTKGEQIWDYLFSYDAAEIILSIVDSNSSKTYFSLGSGMGFKLLDFVMQAYKTTQSSSQIEFSLRNDNPSRRDYLVADISCYSKIINFKLKYLFPDGIKEIIRVHKKRKIYNDK